MSSRDQARNSAGDAEIELTGVYLNACTEIIQPDQVIVFPKYFLDRWARRLGPVGAWTVIAFRQAAYLSKRGTP